MAHETGFSKVFSNRFEKSIYNSIQTRIPNAKVFHNCALSWTNGQITEVDLIVLTTKGLFVLECKDYSGSVTNTDGKWIHTIEHTTKPTFTRRFSDPFYQNSNHIRCLRKHLTLAPETPIYSMVVFSDKTNIDGISYDYPMRTVVQGKTGVCTMLTRILRTRRACLTPDQITTISAQLSSTEPQTELDRLSNVRKIREQKWGKRQKEEKSEKN